MVRPDSDSWMHDYLYQYGDGNNQKSKNNSPQHKPMGHKPGRGPGLPDIFLSIVFKDTLLLAIALIPKTNRRVPKRRPKLAKSQAPLLSPFLTARKVMQKLPRVQIPRIVVKAHLPTIHTF